MRILSELSVIRIIYYLFICLVLGLGGQSCSEDTLVDKGENVHIAYIGPMSGSGAVEGKMMVNGINLYIDRINESGGYNGKQVVLDIYDDQNNHIIAKEEAQKIAEKNRVLAVIGHWYSSCSISGGEIYKAHKIPAVTPGSVSDKVTLDNPYYFRTIYNSKIPGSFLANYIQKVFKETKISIVHETNEYGRSVADSFIAEAEKLGLQLQYKWSYDHNDKTLDDKLAMIVDEINMNKDDAGIIFMSVQALEAVKLIKGIKDLRIKNKIIGPSSFSEDTFKNGFKDFPKELSNSGFYTNNIYVIMPLLFDVANKEAQEFKHQFKRKFKELPSWSAGFAYDSIKVILTAAKYSGVSGNPANLSADREQLKTYLSSLQKVDDSIEGVTGFNYFDENRNGQKSITLCLTKDNNFISALTQLQVIQNPDTIYRLDEKIDNGRVLSIDNKYMYKTDIIYTGVEVNNISNIDMINLTSSIDFNIWFRFKEGFDPKNIEFINAVNPIDLGEAKETEKGEMNYYMYKVKADFKIDALTEPDQYNEHILGIGLKHKKLDRFSFIFVPDVTGMGLQFDRSFFDILQEKAGVITGQKWLISHALLFQNIVKKYSKGNPRYVNNKRGQVEYSKLNFLIYIKNSSFNLNGVIPKGYENYLLMLTVILLLALYIVFKRKNLAPYKRVIFLLNIPVIFLFVLSFEVVIGNLMLIHAKQYLNDTNNAISVTWYLLIGFLINRSIFHYVWTPLENKTKRQIPKVAKQTVSFIIYLIAFFLVIAFVFNQQITGLLAASGVVAMVIGLAVQMNISNIFSGLAINIEQPFRVGDWIEVNGITGRVSNITWRSTRIETAMGNMVSVPNAVISDSTVQNYHLPDDKYWYGFTVHVGVDHRPDIVEKLLLDAVNSIKEVFEPWICFTGLTDWSADYWVYFYVQDYEKRFHFNNIVWIKVWTILNRAGINPAIKRQEIHMFEGKESRGREEATKPMTLLEENDMFASFSIKEKGFLAEKMKINEFQKGESIVDQGSEGSSLFIIVEGVVGAFVKTEDENSIEVARLGPGDFFGEMSLLTGQPRSASIKSMTNTVLYEITKDDISPLIRNNEKISESLSKVLTKRQLENQAAAISTEDAKKHKESMHEKIMGSIQSFFGIVKK